MNNKVAKIASKAINQIQGIEKDVVVKVLVESQQKVHELVFHCEEFKSDDSDGPVLFVEVVIKEYGGVQRILL